MTCLSNRCSFAVLLVALGLVSLIPLGAQTAAPAPAIEAPVVAAADNACLKYLPADWWIMGNVDIKVYLDAIADMSKDQPNPGAAMLDQYMEMAKGLTGIDLRKDVKCCTFFLTGNPDDGVKTLVVVQGSFDNATVETRLGISIGQDARKDSHLDTAIYVGKAMAYSFPEKSTLLIGDEDLVKGAIAAGQKPAAKLPGAMKNTLAMTNARSVVWAAMKPQTLLGAKALGEWSQQNKEFVKALKPIQCASIWIDTAKDGFLVNALATTEDKDQAGELKQYLQGRKKGLLEKDGANVVFASFLVLSDLTSRDNQVKGSVRLTLGALLELWKTKFVVKPAAKVVGG